MPPKQGRQPLIVGNPALIMVDFQRGGPYIPGIEGGVPHVKTDLEQQYRIARALVAAARSARIPVIFITMGKGADSAIEAMKALPTEVAPIMSELLRDDDPDVRILAVNVLESLRHPMVEQWLIEVIDRDPMVNVCGSAVDLLGEVGSEAAHDALERLKLRFGAEPYIQFAVDLALKRISAA